MLNVKKQHPLKTIWYVSICVLILSCQKLLEPPPKYQKQLPESTISIKDLKARHIPGQIVEITENETIKGIIIADDRSGSLFKTIIIDDGTAAIPIRIDQNNLFNLYPIGREIGVELKGLYLGDVSRWIQLGSGIVSSENDRIEIGPIPTTVADKIIQRGGLKPHIKPITIQFNQIHDSLQSRLIEIREVEFQPQDTLRTWANVATRQSMNRTLVNCQGQTLVVRTSAFAKFAGEKTPTGHGSIRGIYTVFNQTNQLLIRDNHPDEIQLTQSRCGFGTPIKLNYDSIVQNNQQNLWNLPNNSFIIGKVISDRLQRNIPSRELVIQNNTGQGLWLRFNSDHNFLLGDSIEIGLTGAQLIRQGNQPIIQNILLQRAKKLGNATTFIASQIDIEYLLANAHTFQSRLIQLEQLRFNGANNANWGGSISFMDTQGNSIIHQTRTGTTGASFANQRVPRSIKRLTAIVSNTDRVQIHIRNLQDLQTSEGTIAPPPTPLLQQNFEQTTGSGTLQISGWTNSTQKGNRTFSSAQFSNNRFAQITAFNSNQPEVTTWLISPPIQIPSSGNAFLQFETQQGFVSAQPTRLRVFISSNYSGQGPAWAAGVIWQELTNITLSPGQTNGYPNLFTASGPISLNAYRGNIHIAWRFEGGDPGRTATWRIDNIQVIHQP